MLTKQADALMSQYYKMLLVQALKKLGGKMTLDLTEFQRAYLHHEPYYITTCETSDSFIVEISPLTKEKLSSTISHEE